uniref:Uncharacterized protein n=1 Tax=Candidatus Methanophaga sp. ANME-1 ERB7 TaxID=2759913 RepID=A0A7G9Z2E3_9EURY|nr:hypothetical protein IPKNHHKO_00001 [Methanosarcinales archaeon ANME-1 ERB7]
MTAKKHLRASRVKNGYPFKDGKRDLLAFPNAMGLQEGVQEITRRVRLIKDDYKFVAVYGCCDSGKSYLIELLQEELGQFGFTISGYGGAPRASDFEAIFQLENDPLAAGRRFVYIFHCGWFRSPSDSEDNSKEDPHILAESVLGRRIHVSVLVSNPYDREFVRSDSSHQVPVEDYNLVISNPDAKKKHVLAKQRAELEAQMRGFEGREGIDGRFRTTDAKELYAELRTKLNVYLKVFETSGMREFVTLGHFGNVPEMDGLKELLKATEYVSEHYDPQVAKYMRRIRRFSAILISLTATNQNEIKDISEEIVMLLYSVDKTTRRSGIMALKTFANRGYILPKVEDKLRRLAEKDPEEKVRKEAAAALEYYE